jgi:hypothetical protein
MAHGIGRIACWAHFIRHLEIGMSPDDDGDLWHSCHLRTEWGMGHATRRNDVCNSSIVAETIQESSTTPD